MTVCLRSAVTVAVALWSALGCSGHAQKPTAALHPASTAPEEGGPRWRELVTPHFVLDTDVPSKDALAWIADLERGQAAILHHLHALADPPPARVVLLARWRDFAKMKGRDMGDGVRGYTGALGDGAFVEPLIVMHTSASLSHALLHLLAQELIPGWPAWLEEGLAMYYGTMSIENDRVSFGRRVWTRGRSLDLSALFAARGEEFAGPSGPSYDETAAALVSLLLDRDWPYRPRYERYVAALAAGSRRQSAWAEAFGDMSLRRLQEDLLQYRRDGFVDTVEEPYRAPAPAEPSVRYLSSVEIHLLWLRLRHDGQDRRHDLDEARREEPLSPEVAMYSGYLAESAGRFDEAEGDFRAAHDAAPDDERFGLALFAYHCRRAQATGAPAAALEPEARALAPAARRPETLNGAAYLFALAQDPDEGLPLARRAVALRPRRFDYLDTLALLLFEKGEVEDALATQERAMAFLPDGEEPPAEMTEHLERYRRAVAEKRGTVPRENETISAPR